MEETINYFTTYEYLPINYFLEDKLGREELSVRELRKPLEQISNRELTRKLD